MILLANWPDLLISMDWHIFWSHSMCRWRKKMQQKPNKNCHRLMWWIRIVCVLFLQQFTLSSASDKSCTWPSLSLFGFVYFYLFDQREIHLLHETADTCLNIYCEADDKFSLIWIAVVDADYFYLLAWTAMNSFVFIRT